ncbi:MAG: gluconate 2-dehydrogenase subunit 3 family protein [Vicinamibacteria bacterium]
MSRTIDRREMLQRLGASAMAPLVAGFHPAIPRQEGGFRPAFLQEAEIATVADLAERIIPETDTPGARGALVHQYVDWALSEGDAATRESFRKGLRSLDSTCDTLFGKPFVDLEAARQDKVLSGLEGDAFFREAKRLTVDGYYRSEVGMKQELGFEGNAFLSEFEGCNHPEHESWKPGE